MKSFFAALIVLTSGFYAHSEELVLQSNNSATFVPENTSTATFSAVNTQKLDPKWRFGFGQSALKFDNGDVGRGLNVFFERGFNHFIGLGGAFANYNSEGYDAPIGSVYTTLTPIRYGFEEFLFSGAVLAGAQAQLVGSRSTRTDFDGTFFYGASLDFNLSNQIGLSLASKAGLTYQAINEISLVGYF